MLVRLKQRRFLLQELRWSSVAEGDWILFDDSFEHEVAHTGAEQVRRRYSLSRFHVRMTILPRHARDKHRGNSKQSVAFLQRVVLVVDVPHPQLVLVLPPAAAAAAAAAKAEAATRIEQANAGTGSDSASNSFCDVSTHATPEDNVGGGKRAAAAALEVLTWPHSPAEFLTEHWQRNALLLPAPPTAAENAADGGSPPPTSAGGDGSGGGGGSGGRGKDGGGYASDDGKGGVFTRQREVLHQHMQLGIDDVWTLLDSPALVTRHEQDRYGGFVKVVNGTMRKWTLTADNDNDNDGSATDGAAGGTAGSDGRPGLAAAAREQYSRGNTIVLENAELFHAAVGRLCLDLARALRIGRENGHF
jgi:hypothetical protein